MLLDLGNGEVELELSFATCVIYERHFQSDMIGDMLGVVEGREEEGEDGETSIVLDYTETNWVSAIQAMWAAAKAADDGTKPYVEWCHSMTNVNMWPLITEFKAEMLARLFRPGATDSE